MPSFKVHYCSNCGWTSGEIEEKEPSLTLCLECSKPWLKTLHYSGDEERKNVSKLLKHYHTSAD